jgi:hypothetical protein
MSAVVAQILGEEYDGHAALAELSVQRVPALQPLLELFLKVH